MRNKEEVVAMQKLVDESNAMLLAAIKRAFPINSGVLAKHSVGSFYGTVIGYREENPHIGKVRIQHNETGSLRDMPHTSLEIA